MPVRSPVSIFFEDFIVLLIELLLIALDRLRFSHCFESGNFFEAQYDNNDFTSPYGVSYTPDDSRKNIFFDVTTC